MVWNCAACPVRITRHHIVFELFNPTAVPQLSEALQKFEIILQGRAVYSGPAVVRNLVDAGSQVVCEATLDEAQWTDLNQILALQQEGQIHQGIQSFLKDWQKFYTVSPEFKIVIADMQTFLYDLRLWLEQVELGIRALPASEQKKLEQPVNRKKPGGCSFRPLTCCTKDWKPFRERSATIFVLHTGFLPKGNCTFDAGFALCDGALMRNRSVTRAITRWST